MVPTRAWVQGLPAVRFRVTSRRDSRQADHRARVVAGYARLMSEHSHVPFGPCAMAGGVTAGSSHQPSARQPSRPQPSVTTLMSELLTKRAVSRWRCTPPPPPATDRRAISRHHPAVNRRPPRRNSHRIHSMIQPPRRRVNRESTRPSSMARQHPGARSSVRVWPLCISLVGLVEGHAADVRSADCREQCARRAQSVMLC
jgi:hypothetical protein